MLRYMSAEMFYNTEKQGNIQCGSTSYIKVVIMPLWNFTSVCICTFRRVFVLATFAVLNNSAAEIRQCYISDFKPDAVLCLLLSLEQRELFIQGDGVMEGWLWLACTSSIPLFSGVAEIENKLEAEWARVKWHVFRIIDFSSCTDGNLTGLFSIMFECDQHASAVISGSPYIDWSMPHEVKE